MSALAKRVSLDYLHPVNRVDIDKIHLDTGKLLHYRAVDKFKADAQSLYVQSLNNDLLPYIAGSSGHTLSLMIGMECYGNFLNVEEKKEYAFAIFAYLAGEGNHTFHEVYIIARYFNIPYQAGEYQASIPKAFMQAQETQAFIEQFWQHFNPPSCTKNQMNFVYGY